MYILSTSRSVGGLRSPGSVESCAGGKHQFFFRAPQEILPYPKGKTKGNIGNIFIDSKRPINPSKK
jgi:hypothetical protein